MQKSIDRSIFFTLFSVVFFICAFGQRGFGFPVVLIIFFMVFIGLPVSLWRIYAKLVNRKNQIIKMALWILCAVCIILIHQIRDYYIRKEVNKIILKIEVYNEKNKKYLASLGELEIDVKKFEEEVTRIRYYFPKNKEDDDFKKPFFMYSSSFNPYNRYYYNFDKKEWIFVPD